VSKSQRSVLSTDTCVGNVYIGPVSKSKKSISVQFTIEKKWETSSRSTASILYITFQWLDVTDFQKAPVQCWNVCGCAEFK